MDQKVILLFGGDSDERLVSVASAQAMAQAISVAQLWFWHKDGPIFKIDYQHLIQHKNPFTDELTPISSCIYTGIKEAIESPSSDNHVFLLGLHGGKGENGYVQELLEKAKRPFTGSTAQASRRAFDKIATKYLLKDYHINMAQHLVINAHDQEINTKLKVFYETHGRSIVKPVCGGSSIGSYSIRCTNDVETVATAIAQKPQAYLAEKFIAGREITVGVIEGSDGPRGLPCTEIVLEHQHDFDYQGKYLGIGAQEITPAPLSASLTREAQRLATAAHAALSLEGYSRTDLILSPEGFYFLETNTLPGLAKQSLVPQQLAACGISMKEFLWSQIEFAMKRKT